MRLLRAIRRRKRLCLFLMLGLVLLAGCYWPLSLIPEAFFIQRIPTAEKLILYEGLPHPLWERDVLEKELGRSDVRELHGFPFYMEPLPLSPEDAERLTEILSTPSAYSANIILGLKLC